MYNKIYLPLIVVLNSSLAFSRPAVNQQSADMTATATATSTATPTATPTSVTPASPNGVRQNGSGPGLESSGASATVPTAPAPTAPGPTVRDAAKQSSDASRLTSVVSGVTGGVMMAAGARASATCPAKGPECPMAPMYFMMGAQAMMQAAASQAQSKDARNTQKQVDWNSGGTNADYSSYLQDAGVSPTELTGIQRSLASHQGLNGFKLSQDGKTLTTPDGKKLPTSLASTRASMAKAGFSSAAIDGAMRAVRKAEKTVIEKMGAHTNALGFAEASGGGTNSGSAAGSADGAGAGYGGAYGVNSKPLRDPAAASVAGLSSDFNGERIGVAQDELFQMISRRYDHKMQREGEGFLPASLLAPR